MHAHPGRHKAFGQPRLLKLRIGYAHRNHSDYPTRITMQMLVNSHVPVRLQDRCAKSYPPPFFVLTPLPGLRPRCDFHRAKDEEMDLGLLSLRLLRLSFFHFARRYN